MGVCSCCVCSEYIAHGQVALLLIGNLLMINVHKTIFLVPLLKYLHSSVALFI
jgi:hypothetical protein